MRYDYAMAKGEPSLHYQERRVAEILKNKEDSGIEYIVLTGSDRVCKRCGALVHKGGRSFHTAWHKKLNATLAALGLTEDALDAIDEVLERP